MDDWKLHSALDLAAYLAHKTIIEHGFRLISTGDAPSNLAIASLGNLPLTWNYPPHSTHISLSYRHEASSMTYTLKAIFVGSDITKNEQRNALILVLNAIEAIAPGKYLQHSLEMPVDAPQFQYPFALARVNQDLVDASTQLAQFNQRFRQQIVSRLIQPSTNASSSSATGGSSSTDSSRQPQPPRSTGPTEPFNVSSNENPLNIGRSDLDPLASLTRPPNSGTGMLVGPEHPMFTGGFHDFEDPSMPSTNPLRLPPGAVPQGARFDPFTPLGGHPGVPGGLRGRGGRGRGGRGGRGGFGPRSGEPDNDEFGPPGYSDMFM